MGCVPVQAARRAQATSEPGANGRSCRPVTAWPPTSLSALPSRAGSMHGHAVQPWRMIFLSSRLRGLRQLYESNSSRRRDRIWWNGYAASRPCRHWRRPWRVSSARRVHRLPGGGAERVERFRPGKPADHLRGTGRRNHACESGAPPLMTSGGIKMGMAAAFRDLHADRGPRGAGDERFGGGADSRRKPAGAFGLSLDPLS